jgi:hypothetical protein
VAYEGSQDDKVGRLVANYRYHDNPPMKLNPFLSTSGLLTSFGKTSREASILKEPTKIGEKLRN